MTHLAPPPVILDFDGSVLPIAADALRIPLLRQQESVRFGCSLGVFRQFESGLRASMPARHGCVFLGSGDFHHVSAALLARLDINFPVDLVVCDNHPDNMRYPFGIHCGSWVRYASKMAHIRHIHVIGISSDDITWRHAWENYLSPLFGKKLTYWSVGTSAAWLDALGLGSCHRCFAAPDELLQAFLPELATAAGVYLSLDKDVFSPETAQTNWDQGTFEESHLKRLIEAVTGRLVGADVCGEISEYRYQHWFKRLLSRLDGQKPLDPLQLPRWQQAHQALNIRLLRWMNQAMKND